MKIFLKIVLIFFLTISTLFSSEALNGVHQEFANGRLWREFTYINGVKDGIGKYFYESGEVQSECLYKNNKKEGIERRFFDNKLIAEVPYKNDREEGRAIFYYTDGKVYRDIVFSKGKAMFGIEFYKNGQERQMTNADFYNAGIEY